MYTLAMGLIELVKVLFYRHFQFASLATNKQFSVFVTFKLVWNLVFSIQHS